LPALLPIHQLRKAGNYENAKQNKSAGDNQNLHQRPVLTVLVSVFGCLPFEQTDALSGSAPLDYWWQPSRRFISRAASKPKGGDTHNLSCCTELDQVVLACSK
jgi:hypothetical protein